MKALLTMLVLSVYSVPTSVFWALVLVSTPELSDFRGFRPFIV